MSEIGVTTMRDPRALGPVDKSLRRAVRETVRYKLVNPARFLRDRAILATRRSTEKRPTRRIALVSDGLAYCSEEQLAPFRDNRAELRDRYKLISVDLRLDDVLRRPRQMLRGFDWIGIKFTYRTPADQALAMLRRLKEAAPHALLVYFDGDDDACIQWPDVLREVDLYIKKHVFADRSMYRTKFLGKSNLHDHVQRTTGYVLSPLDYGNVGDGDVMISSSGPVADDDLKKVKLGWNIALDTKITQLFDQHKMQEWNDDKSTDILFRGSKKDKTITYPLRDGIAEKLSSLSDRYTINIGSSRVSQDEYNRELNSSRICVSPFGFGEICWRDFEAVIYGSLLVKPDMSHISTEPDIFVANETYIPVKWDYSDLNEKCAYYLEHETERRRIVERAYAVLADYLAGGRFAAKASALLEPRPSSPD